jgi:hypothetical protein
VTAHRILRLFLLATLVLASFGRLGVAQAQAPEMPSHSAPAAMAGHCADQPAPPADGDKSDRVDCMAACAAMAAPAGAAFAPPPTGAMARAASPAPTLAGIRPEAEPPPPRCS